MIQREHTLIGAPAERIWSILGDPKRMCQWNLRCTESTAAENAMRVGLYFQVSMSFGGGPERKLNCEVVDCQPNHRLALRFSGPRLSEEDEHVEETFVLQPVANATEVLHLVDFSHAGLPWYVRAFMRFAHLLHRGAGDSPLVCLKELAETPEGEAGE